MEELLATIVDALSAQVPAREAEALREALAKWRGSVSTVPTTQASPAPQSAPAGTTTPIPPITQEVQ